MPLGLCHNPCQATFGRLDDKRRHTFLAKLDAEILDNHIWSLSHESSAVVYFFGPRTASNNERPVCWHSSEFVAKNHFEAAWRLRCCACGKSIPHLLIDKFCRNRPCRSAPYNESSDSPPCKPRTTKNKEKQYRRNIGTQKQTRCSRRCCGKVC